VLWVVFAGRLLVRDREAVRADAVVVLSGDPLGDRLRAGGRVFVETGSGRFVTFLEGADAVYDTREAALSFLEERGIGGDVVRPLPSQSSTADEAAVFAAYAEACGWRSVVVVTSPYHTARAGWLFGRALGSGTEVTTVASAEPYDGARWWRSARDREVTLLEWVKIASSFPYVVSRPQAEAPDAPC
jgi:uncharacterized SAM-binding protein YcdF (DUF218 family)